MRTIRRSATMIGCLCAVMACAVAAQRNDAGGLRWPASVVPAPAASRASWTERPVSGRADSNAISTLRLALGDTLVPPPRTYWLAGFIVGGGIGLVSGLQLQNEVRHDSDNNACTGFDHLAFLVPTVVFALIGGLIGSGIHRD